MSYKCEIGGEVMGRGQKPKMVTVETRQKKYPVREDELENVIDEGGIGFETVKEVRACPACAEYMVQ